MHSSFACYMTVSPDDATPLSTIERPLADWRCHLNVSATHRTRVPSWPTCEVRHRSPVGASRPLEASSKMPLLRTAEDIPADESAAEFQERFVNVGPTIEANAKTAEVMEPGVGPFNHPAEFSEATAVFGAAPRNDWLDTALAQELAMRVGIVATICKDDLGLLKRPAARAADGNYRIDERQQLGTALRWAPVRMALMGTPLASTRMWCLEPGRARSVGFGPVFRPPQRLVSTRNRLRRTRGRSGRPRAACRAAIRVVGPTPLPSASRADAANRLRPSRSPTGSADGSTAARSSTRTECHLARPDPIRAGDLDASCAAALALAITVRSVSTVRHQ